MLWKVVALCLVLAFVKGQGPQVITVTNDETEGNWGPLETCPSGSRAVSYQTQNEVNAPVTDDSALNSIILFCNDPQSTNITSTIGYTGYYQTTENCLVGSFLTAFQLKVSPNGNETDNSAANNIQFRCSNGREISGTGNRKGYWGDYSDECLEGICGIETRVRPGGGFPVDNTALNDVRFTCCNTADGQIY